MGWRKSLEQGEALFPQFSPAGQKITDVTGWVYIAGAYERNNLMFIKIGYTAAKNPQTRIDDIAQGTPHEVRLLTATPGCRALELFYHREFHKSHVRGEWFAPTGEIMCRVDTLNARGDAWRPSKTGRIFKGKRFRHAR